jgi:hypothetical protein
MGKITSYLLILSSVILLFYFAGLIPDTASFVLLKLLIDPSLLITSAFYTNINNAIGLAAVTGIAVGSIISGRTAIAMKVGLAGFLLTIGWDLIQIFNKIKPMNLMVSTLIFAPLLIVYMLSIMEWWTTGTD